jgi:hypothetical protein
LAKLAKETVAATGKNAGSEARAIATSCAASAFIKMTVAKGAKATAAVIARNAEGKNKEDAGAFVN